MRVQFLQPLHKVDLFTVATAQPRRALLFIELHFYSLCLLLFSSSAARPSVIARERGGSLTLRAQEASHRASLPCITHQPREVAGEDRA